MQDEGAAVPQSPAIHRRVGRGMTRPHNWYQLVKFCAVGGSGVLVNMLVFSTLSEWVFHLHHLVAATIAFVIALMNNFWWNRHWTFGAREGHPGFQAARFFVVSLVAFGIQASILELLVSVAGLPPILAQGISIAIATPVNFVGNKMWSFGRRGR